MIHGNIASTVWIVIQHCDHLVPSDAWIWVRGLDSNPNQEHLVRVLQDAGIKTAREGYAIFSRAYLPHFGPQLLCGFDEVWMFTSKPSRDILDTIPGADELAITTDACSFAESGEAVHVLEEIVAKHNILCVLADGCDGLNFIASDVRMGRCIEESESS